VVSSGYGYSLVDAHPPSHEAAASEVVHPFEIGAVGNPNLEITECRHPPRPAALDRDSEQSVVE
jgi:hypothetical protein